MYYLSVILPEWIWILIDGVIVVFTIYSLSQAKALNHLEPRRPTAQLLGPETLLSIFSMAAVNWTFLYAGIFWLFQQSWFLCNEFDSSAVDAAKWWLMGDNFESTLIALIVVPQFINNGAVFNFGHFFRRSWWTNHIYVFVYISFMTIASVLILTGPNWFTCLFRINCGTASVLETLDFIGNPKVAFPIPDYNCPIGHNVLPYLFRWQLWLYVIGNAFLNFIVQRLMVLGPVREYLRSKFPLKRKVVPL
jgi:cation-transporting ATPase 13A3/4/5